MRAGRRISGRGAESENDRASDYDDVGKLSDATPRRPDAPTMRTAPMATEAQIAANRADVQKSTGPKTPPGKATCSQNSTKLGLAGSTAGSLIASETDRAFIAQRKASWRPEFDPQGPEEEYLFEEMVAQSVRVGRCVD